MDTNDDFRRSVLGAHDEAIGDPLHSPVSDEEPKTPNQSPYVDRAAARRALEQQMKAVGAQGSKLGTTALTFNQIMVGGERQSLAPIDTSFGELVKGLDRALLERQRKDLLLQEKSPITTSSVERETDFQASEGASQWASFLRTRIHRHSVAFQPAIEKLMGHVAAGGRFKGNTQIFLPGRMFYIFDSGPNLRQLDVPTSVFKTRGGDKEYEEEIRNNRRCIRPSELSYEVLKNCQPHSGIRSQPAAEKVISSGEDHTKDDEIFPGVGPLNIDEEVAKWMESKREQGDPDAVTTDDFLRDELLSLEQGRQKLSDAIGNAAKIDALERESSQAEKNRLERAPDKPLPPEENPFSLKNVSLIPLINMRTADHKGLGPRLAYSRAAYDASERADAEYGVTSLDFDEWEDQGMPRPKKRGKGRSIEANKRKKVGGDV